MQKKTTGVLGLGLLCILMLSGCGESEEKSRQPAKSAVEIKAEKVIKQGNLQEALQAAMLSQDKEMFEALMKAEDARKKSLLDGYIAKIYPKLTDEICNIDHVYDGFNQNPELLSTKFHQLL